jgi:hypothetical protein
MIAAVLKRRELPIAPELRRIKLTTRGGLVKDTIVLSEAASVLSLPVHWPGMPPVFGRDGGPLLAQ